VAPATAAPVATPAAGCYGVTDPDALAIIARESGCRLTARNPSGAYGIGQLITEHSDDPATQVTDFNNYVMARYGSYAAALAHEDAYGWY
jgi:hypothetical protein